MASLSANSFASDSDESPEKLKNKFEILKELLKKDLSDDERKNLQEKLKTIQGQIPPQKKPLIAVEESPITPQRQRFFIEGKYWLSYIEGGDKEAASLYNIETKEAIGSIETSPGPANAFIISGGFMYANGSSTFIRLWHLNVGDSLQQTGTSSVGISGTEGSDYYYQNINQWGTSTFAARGADSVDADSKLEGTNIDIIHSTAIGNGANKEFGVALGLKYAQVDSDYEITYSSSASPLYNIKSNVENTLLGPIFGIYGKGPIFKKLTFAGLFNAAVTWDHVIAKRSEYDYTVSQAAVPDVSRSSDIVVAVLEGEMGIRYPLGRNILFSLDYKTSYFSGLPFEFKPTESTLIDTIELSERNILFHGMTAGISYSF